MDALDVPGCEMTGVYETGHTPHKYLPTLALVHKIWRNPPLQQLKVQRVMLLPTPLTVCDGHGVWASTPIR